MTVSKHSQAYYLDIHYHSDAYYERLKARVPEQASAIEARKHSERAEAIAYHQANPGEISSVPAAANSVELAPSTQDTGLATEHLERLDRTVATRSARSSKPSLDGQPDFGVTDDQVAALPLSMGPRLRDNKVKLLQALSEQGASEQEKALVRTMCAS